MADLTGYGVGNDAVFGQALILNGENSALVTSLKTLSKDESICRLKIAFDVVESDYKVAIEDSKDSTLKDILSAQLSLITDPELAEAILASIELGKSLPDAIESAIQEFSSLLLGASAEFEERIADLKEFETRLIEAAAGQSSNVNFPIDGEWIVVSNDLSPLLTSRITPAVKGVVTRDGGPTSHTAIVCRQLKIPAIVGCGDISKIVKNQILTLDPANGAVHLGQVHIKNKAPWWANFPPQEKIIFRALGNVGSVADALLVSSSQAVGVGLLRTELLFLDYDYEPSVEEQFSIYSKIVSNCPSGDIVFRTLDAGSDKPIPFLGLSGEENPALGVRGQRVSWVNPKFFENQLHAIRRVATSSPEFQISLMAPMISTLEEATRFSSSALEAGFKSVGIMIEVPSIVEEITKLPDSINFLSIGTNDLSQYLFAADRQNSAVAHLLDPWQPALLQTISRICKLSKSRELKVGVCGEAASDPLLAVVLVGLGVDSLSAGAGSVADLVAISQILDQNLAESAAFLALAAGSASEARSAVRNLLTPSK